MAEQPDRNLALELARVTEAAALAASRWMGRGDRNAADQAAVDAMHLILSTIDMRGIIVIGEGEKGETPMLYHGEVLGTGAPPDLDIAVDAIDGTMLTATGGPGSLAVVAMAERGTMHPPSTFVYMQKIAVGAEARDVIDIDQPVAYNLHAIARALGKQVDDLTVMILDRPRHQQLINDVREVGSRIRLIRDGDVAGAIAAARPATGIDVLLGIGGSSEALIAAAALKCLGGGMQCKLWPRNQAERDYAGQHGHNLNQVFSIDDLVAGENVFFAATGITDGELVDGVRFVQGGATTSSVVMRSKSGTIRNIISQHRWDKLMRISQIGYAQPSPPIPD
jgi:fructose-1,6-bisphosphatase II